MPTVSIIVPNYNHARFLRQRIDSILAQTYQDFELILLDDCSTDDSAAILREYASHPRVTQLVFNETNSGSTFKQWNKGVRLARGKYVWIAESDDYADPPLLARLVALLNSDSAIAFAYCRSWRVTPDGIIGFADYNLPDPGRWTSDFCVDGIELFRRYFALITPVPNASAALFRKDLFERIGCADESLRLCGDWKLWAAMSLSGKVAYASEAVNYFRYHANNARSRTAQAGTDILEYMHVTRWVLDRVSLSAAELQPVLEARAKGWVPALLSFRTTPNLRREIFAAVKALDPHPLRRVFRPALSTVRRKILRHSREVRALFSRRQGAVSNNPPAKVDR
ncbi:MAG: glycosyltransferase family 2 protein [Candidatus Acidiferrales bacterium]